MIRCSPFVTRGIYILYLECLINLTLICMQCDQIKKNWISKVVIILLFDLCYVVVVDSPSK